MALGCRGRRYAMGRKAWYAVLTLIAEAACLFIPGAQVLMPYIAGVGAILTGAHAYTDAKLSQHDPRKQK